MHDHDLSAWTPPHHFHQTNQAGERGARAVLIITLLTMLVEILAGWWYNSMALLADGWHMSSHALALGLTAFAYAAARHYAKDARFAFGTWKIEVLAGFTSALSLVVVALIMLSQSVARLLQPEAIGFDAAILVAVIGLVVNLVCARLLHHGQHKHTLHEHDGHSHSHSHEHEHEHAASACSHGHHHQDLNLKSAYLHVLADAATSVLAIAALLGGKYLGWVWLDPVMGILGGILVGVWAVSLLRESGAALLDREESGQLREALMQRLQGPACGGDIEIADLHVWRVGAQRYAAIITLVTHRLDLTPQSVRRCLADLPGLYHVTVEVNRCLSVVPPTGIEPVSAA